jgi:WD40 repeat protein
MTNSSTDRIRRVYGALIGSIAAGRPRWGTANPYLLRHLAGYAVAVDRLDDLLADPEFLVYGHPSTVAGHVSAARAPAAQANVAIWRASASRHLSATPAERRQLLSLDAARFNLPALSNRLASPADHGRPLDWVPRWSTGAQVTYALLTTFTGHTHPVLAVAAAESAGGIAVASGDSGGVVHVWDAFTGERLSQPLARPAGSVRALALRGDDGELVLVSGGDDGRLRRWNVGSGRALAGTDAGHRGAVSAVTTGSAGRRPVVISGADDGTVQISGLSDGEVLHTVRLDGVPNDLTVVPDGTELVVVAALSDGTVTHWRTGGDGAAPGRLGAMPGGARTIEVAELGERRLAIAGDAAGALRAWDLPVGTDADDAYTSIDRPVSWIRAAVQQGRSVLVAACGDDVGVCGAGARWDYLPGHEDEVLQVATVSGRDVAISGGLDRTVRTWTLAPPAGLSRPQQGHRTPVRAVAVGTLAGRQVIASCGDTSVWLRDAVDGEVLERLELGVPATTVELGEVGGRPVVAAAGADRAVRLRYLTGPPDGPLLVGHAGWVTCATFGSFDGRPFVVTGANDGTARIWDAATGEQARPPMRTRHGWFTAVGSAVVDGRTVIVTGGSDRAVQVWDPGSATALASVVAHAGVVAALAVAPVTGSAPVLHTASADGTIRRFELPDLRPLPDPIRGPASFTCLDAGVLDGEQVLVAGDRDGTVRIWSVSTAMITAVLRFPHMVTAVRLAGPAGLVVGFGRDVAVLERNTPWVRR